MKQPTLKELQLWMKSRIDLRSGEAQAGTIVAFNPQGGDPGEARLAVYSGGYVARTYEALREVYEALFHVIGERRARQLASEYARKFASRDYNLTFFGRNLPEFLTDYPDTRDLPFLPDLARLEWLVAQAFHAFEKPPLDTRGFAALSQEDWEHIRFSFQPSLGLLSSEWPVLDVWQARKQPREQINVDLMNRPQRIILFRQGYPVHAQAVTREEFRLLRVLQSGKNLGHALEIISSEMDPDRFSIPDCLSKWAAVGILTGFEISRS